MSRSTVSIVVAVITVLGSLIGTYMTVSSANEKVRRADEQAQRATMLTSTSAAGHYEWQWAGDGWKGYLNVDGGGNAHLEMQKFMQCGDTKKVVDLLKQEGDGKAEVNSDGTILKVSIPVRFATYDANCSVNGFKDIQTLVGTLDRKIAFAGLVEYRTPGHAPLGDMVLVKDYASGPH